MNISAVWKWKVIVRMVFSRLERATKPPHFLILGLITFVTSGLAADGPKQLLIRPGLYKSLTDRVLAWVRGAHNGGAIPIRHFLAAPRVINDTYGLFFYDPDGGYVSAFVKDSGYEFQGWRRGVMIVKGP